jgi:hypothetical protein
MGVTFVITGVRTFSIIRNSKNRYTRQRFGNPICLRAEARVWNDLSLYGLLEGTNSDHWIWPDMEPELHSELLGFWAFSIVRYSGKQKTRRVGNWICFRSQAKGRHLHSWAPERANLDYCEIHYNYFIT